MNHPSVDTYADQPTLEKRIKAVKKGFGIDVVLKPIHYSESYDLFNYSYASLLKYPNGVTEYDISGYAGQTNKFPKSICYYKNNYWIYGKIMMR